MKHEDGYPTSEERSAVRGRFSSRKTPRILSRKPTHILRFAGPTGRTQEHIQSMLEKMEHVKELRSQIDRDGQVNEPPFCIPVPKDSELSGEFDYQVLEGNSRLAALRMTKPGSLPQASLICHILDFSAYGENEREGLIFSLLGQYHITARPNGKATRTRLTSIVVTRIKEFVWMRWRETSGKLEQKSKR